MPASLETIDRKLKLLRNKALDSVPDTDEWLSVWEMIDHTLDRRLKFTKETARSE